MDIQEYISSGILELYVYGALSEEESRKVTQVLREYPEVKAEVEEIERALSSLATSAAPYNPQEVLTSLKTKLAPAAQPPVTPRRKYNIVAYLGWAASLLLLIGLFFLFRENNHLRKALSQQDIEKAQMEQQIADARADAQKTKELLNIFRSREIQKVPLQGQNVDPGAYAAVYWDKQKNKAFIDAQGLPEPPRGKVYQVWSLKMQPLTPTSIGLLKDFGKDENKVFSLENANESEAFGITLEPEGGSKTPTMDQLYVLGTVASL